MKSHEVRTGHILGSIALMLLVFLGCNASASSPAPTTIAPASPVATPTDTFTFSSPTPRPSRTPFPTRTPLPTPIPTPLPTATVVPPIRIYDEVMHPDWSLEFSDVEIDTRHSADIYTGFYAIEIRPIQPHQTFFLSLNSTAAKAYPVGAVRSISFQLFSGINNINPSDLELSIIGSNDVPFYSPDQNGIVDLSAESAEISDNSFASPFDVAFPPKTLDQLGISAPIPPQTWVYVTYDLQEHNPTSSYQWLTGFYIENSSALTQPYLIDDLKFVTAGN